MPGMARVFVDMFSGICCCYENPPPTCIGMTGYIITGSTKHTGEGSGIAQFGSIVIGECGHTGRIITGSSKSKSEGVDNAFQGSTVTGCLIGSIITGSTKVITGL